ncbi:hypothetical protein DKE46_011225 [Acinetobacter pittii]|nr:hypothetical protein DKE46_011225 [Acinetobacter pittii]
MLNFIHSLPIIYKDNVFAIFLKNENREQVLWMRKFLVTFLKKVMELATFFGDKTVRLRRDNH